MINKHDIGSIISITFTKGNQNKTVSGQLLDCRQSIQNNEVIYHLQFAHGNFSVMMRSIIKIERFGCKSESFWKENIDRPRGLYKESEQDMKVKVATIIEGAEKRLEAVRTSYEDSFQASMGKYKQEVEEFLASDFSNILNVVAPVFGNVRNDVPSVERDLRFLKALADTEISITENHQIRVMFEKYVVFNENR